MLLPLSIFRCFLRFAFALLLINAATLTLHAATSGNFTYTDDGTSISITGYPTNAVGVVEIPASIVGKPVTSIGASAFQDCQSLTSVTIPDSVTSIGTNAFQSCYSLTSVTLGNGVTSIGASAFLNCQSLTSVTIPDSVTSIGTSPFQSCLSLTAVSVSPLNPYFSSLNGILFNKSQKTLIQYPAGITGSYPIPDSVTSIGTSAFHGCSRLTSVVANNVTSLGTSAFQNCANLTSVTLGNGVASIGANGFLNCTRLTIIYIKGNAPTLGTTVFSTNPISNVYYLLGTTGWASTFGGLGTVALGLPTITAQPSSVIANVGENAAFSVIAKTIIPLTLGYQWQRNGLAIPGATAASLYLNNIQPANVGTYAVIITNDSGSVASTVTLTLTQGAFYTQTQYEAALQMGLNAGLQAGRTQVTESPNNYGLYSLTQVQALNVGTPLLTKDQVSGKFKLTIGAKKSADLSTYTALPFSSGDATINAQGEMEFQFTSPDNAAFFRLESH